MFGGGVGVAELDEFLVEQALIAIRIIGRTIVLNFE
jgi:hypothetical protein